LYMNTGLNNKLEWTNRPDKEENNVIAVQLMMHFCQIYANGRNMDSRS